jgi:hypothetical protein
VEYEARTTSDDVFRYSRVSCCGTVGDSRDIEVKQLALERLGKLPAIQLKDLKIRNEVLDENFVVVDQDGALTNKAQVLAYVQMATSLQYLTNEMTVRLHGNTAVVTGTYRLNGILAGRRIEQRGRIWSNTRLGA